MSELIPIELKDRPIRPESVGYLTELDAQYISELTGVASAEEFGAFLQRWEYWVDEQSKNLTAADWEHLKPLLDDCRREGAELTEKHQRAIRLIFPQRLFRISDIACRMNSPWGAVYLQLRKHKRINY